MTTSKINSQLVSFKPSGTGSVVRTLDSKLRESVSVLDFGADPTGVLDSSDAFNLATKSSYTSTGIFDQNFPGCVLVPAGLYKLSNTVYVHKGQHLCGEGGGATKIDVSGMVSVAEPVFKLGWSASSEDGGGLPPEISEFWIYGGPDSYPVIDISVAGSFVHDVFFTSPGVAIKQSGGDTIVTNCIIDQGLNGILISGQNHITSNVLFYNMNYGISVGVTYDAQINNCHFEYGKYSDIIFSGGSDGSQNISISNCQFVANAQYSTFDYSIHMRANSINVNIRGCDFRNQKSYGIAAATGLAGLIIVSDCVFNGVKTNPAYDQSVSAAGIFTGNHTFEVVNCKFINLLFDPVTMPAVLTYPVSIIECTYSNITNAGSFVHITGTAGSVTISGCIGDGILPLINLQSGVSTYLRGNKLWLGAKQTISSRDFWKIPTQGASVIRVGLKGNTAPGGNSLYGKSATLLVARHIDYNGTALADYVEVTPLYESPASGYVPALDINVALDVVGGGTTFAYVNLGRYIVLSMPSSYFNNQIEADYEI